mmetsp:Transcript_33869/g.89760  ORF Transcript_33869/g.89760 Transcript_33869/m.89760 type:complete len:401 (+) Transcript_33869:105-1307(+)
MATENGKQAKVYVVKFTAEIYASASSPEVLGLLQEGEQVTVTGPPESYDGYVMVPVEPSGVVDSAALQLLVAEGGRIRNLRKKLAEIEALERRVAEEGAALTPAQEEKLGRRAQMEEELEALRAAETAAASFAAAEAAEVTVESVTPRDDQPKVAPLASPSARPPFFMGGPPGSPAFSSTMDPHLACRSPSMRWREDPLGVEDMRPMPRCPEVPSPPKEPEFVEAVQPFSPAARADERLQMLLRQVSELSMDAFEEDACLMVSRKGKWKLTLLACPAGSDPDEFSLEPMAPSLIGFLVYRLRPELQSLSIAKLAIVPEHRRRGHGCRIIDWCVKAAKTNREIAYIALSSLPEAVRFYQRLGFRQFDLTLKNGDLAPDEDFVEGQVYMEKAIKGGGRRKKK